MPCCRSADSEICPAFRDLLTTPNTGVGGPACSRACTPGARNDKTPAAESAVGALADKDTAVGSGRSAGIRLSLVLIGCAGASRSRLPCTGRRRLRTDDRGLRQFVVAERSTGRSHRRGRSRERVRERHLADRRALCEGQRGHEQPQHRPARVRGEPRASPRTVGRRKVVVQNGVGYDDFMNKIESASPSSSRTVIDVQKLLGVPDSAPNPHLWYKPTTMPPSPRRWSPICPRCSRRHAAYFRANERRFDASAAAVAWRAEGVSHPPPRHDGGDDRAGQPTTCCRPPGYGTSRRSRCRPTS